MTRLPKITAATYALTRRAADFPSNASCCLWWPEQAKAIIVKRIHSKLLLMDIFYK
jgi:hypothetical protein